MRAKILGKVWEIVFTPRVHLGDCDGPHIANKKIRIAKKLKDEQRLEVIIHELLHAANWHLDEEWVEQAGIDIARVLWRLGYRERADESE